MKYQFTAYNHGWCNEIGKIPRFSSTFEVTSSRTDFPCISYEARLLVSKQLTGHNNIAKKSKAFLVDLHKEDHVYEEETFNNDPYDKWIRVHVTWICCMCYGKNSQGLPVGAAKSPWVGGNTRQPLNDPRNM